MREKTAECVGLAGGTYKEGAGPDMPCALPAECARPGRSNFHESCRRQFSEALCPLDIAAAGDGRTPHTNKAC
jgi:hypothetical protein